MASLVWVTRKSESSLFPCVRDIPCHSACSLDGLDSARPSEARIPAECHLSKLGKPIRKRDCHVSCEGQIVLCSVCSMSICLDIVWWSGVKEYMGVLAVIYNLNPCPIKQQRICVNWVRRVPRSRRNIGQSMHVIYSPDTD